MQLAIKSGFQKMPEVTVSKKTQHFPVTPSGVSLPCFTASPGLEEKGKKQNGGKKIKKIKEKKFRVSRVKPTAPTAQKRSVKKASRWILCVWIVFHRAEGASPYHLYR